MCDPFGPNDPYMTQVKEKTLASKILRERGEIFMIVLACIIGPIGGGYLIGIFLDYLFSWDVCTNDVVGCTLVGVFELLVLSLILYISYLVVVNCIWDNLVLLYKVIKPLPTIMKRDS